MRCRSADWIKRLAADDQIEIGAVRRERVVPRRADFRAGLPPAVLANDYTRIEVLVQPRTGTYTALRRCNRYPVAVRDATCLRRRGVQFHFRMRGAVAQTGQCAMLSRTEKRWFRPGQDQREALHQIRPRHWAGLWLHEIGQGRVAVVEEGLRIEFDLARRRGKASGRAFGVQFRVFGVSGLQCHPHAPWRGAQLLKRDASRRELVPVSSIDVAIPELRGKAKAPGKVKDDVGIRTRFAWRRNDGLA